MTRAQRRLVEILQAHDGQAEYWPVVNDWVIDRGPVQSLALRNINRTIAALIRDGHVTLSDEGMLCLTTNPS